MPSQRLLSLAIPIVLRAHDAGDDPAPPAEFRILKAGVNETSKGPILFDEAAAQAVMAAYSRRNMRVVIDYVHQAVSRPPVDAPAAGWMDLELRDGDLWATGVEWTPKAAGQIAAKEYQFYSPTLFEEEAEFEGRPCTRPTMLLTVSLTNIPAMDGLTPLLAMGVIRDLRLASYDSSLLSFGEITRALEAALNKRFPGRSPSVCEVDDLDVVFEINGRTFQTPYSLDGSSAVVTGEAFEVRQVYVPVEGGVVMKNVLAALSLGASATEGEAMAAVNQLTDLQREVYSLTGKASISEAVGTLRGMKASAAEARLLDAKLKEVELAQRKAEVNALVQQGLAEQKLTARMKGWAEQYGLADLAGFKSYLEAAVPLSVLADTGVREAGPAAGGATGGVKWETLKPMEKHNLFHENRGAYDAVKDEYERRTGRRVG